MCISQLKAAGTLTSRQKTARWQIALDPRNQSSDTVRVSGTDTEEVVRLRCLEVLPASANADVTADEESWPAPIEQAQIGLPRQGTGLCFTGQISRNRETE